jgi:rhomboid protease GluP
VTTLATKGGAGASGSGAAASFVPLRTPFAPGWVVGSVAFFALVPIGVALGRLLQWPPDLAVAGLVGSMACLVAGYATRNRTTRRIELTTDRAIIPMLRTPVVVPYADVAGVHLVRSSWPERVAIARAGGRPTALPASEFAEPDGADQLVAEIRRRIAALPDGAERIREIDRRDAAYFAPAPGRRWLLPALVAVLTAAFAVEIALGAAGSAALLTALGASIPAGRGGGWHRLVTANFLHASAGHWLINAGLLLLVGRLLARWLDSWRLWIVLALSGPTGFAAAALLPPHGVTVGASTMLWGVFGALLVLSVARRKELAEACELPLVLSVQAAAYLTLLGLGSIQGVPIDHAGHAGGALGGALAFAWGAWGTPLGELREPPGRGVRGTAIALAIVFAAGLAVGAERAWRDVPAALASRSAE